MTRPFRIVLDVACIIVFVAIGRSTHDHGVSLPGMLSTTWPFVSGLTLGWISLVSRRRSGASAGDGLTVVVATVAAGMVLRVLSGQGTAVAFIIVALAFLSLTMLGWRLLARVRLHQTK